MAGPKVDNGEREAAQEGFTGTEFRVRPISAAQCVITVAQYG